MKAKNEATASVSVVMCTFNGRRFLREQMESILAQDYPLHEIIVQDDGSTDDTWDLLEAYQRDHPHLIKIHRNMERLGFNRNFHSVMLRATGDFIAISDQDDIWFPQKIRRQVESIGQADLCFSEYYTDDHFIQPLKKLVSPRTEFEHLLFLASTPGHTMLLRRDFLHNVKVWDYDIYYDWWLIIHAHLGHGVAKVNEPLNWHRHYAGSVTTRVAKKGFYEPVAHPTWQPYVWGLLHRLHLQKKRSYRFLYTYLTEHIDPAKQPLAARMAPLMLTHNPLGILRLCLLCGKHFDRIYPGHPTGLKGRIHGFFYPFISAYGNDLFNLEK